jgi:NYN domain/OST-HTH/LOTUS domain
VSLPTSPLDAGHSLAILIDAENTPVGCIGEVMTSCATYGRANIIRAYGDWMQQTLSPWRDIFREYPITAVQQFHYIPGKNSSDSAMNIDAMDIISTKRVDTFILVTSDSDFTRLATRAREEGLRVIGVGQKSSARSFVKACDQFLYLENLYQPPGTEKKESKVTKVKPQAEAGTKPPMPTIEGADTGKELLEKAALAWQAEDSLITGTQLAELLRRLDPGFSPRNYGFSTIAQFVSRYPSMITRTGRTKGVDVIYEIKQSSK